MCVLCVCICENEEIVCLIMCGCGCVRAHSILRMFDENPLEASGF